jgi:hypothetical protein
VVRLLVVRRFVVVVVLVVVLLPALAGPWTIADAEVVAAASVAVDDELT